MSDGRTRLSGQYLVRLARGLTPPAVHERVLVPLLADYQHEHAHATGRLARASVRVAWVIAFWSSLATELVRIAGQHVRENAWGTSEPERLSARLFLRGVVLSAAAVSLLVVLDFVRRPRFGSSIADMGLLLPAIIGMAVPLACLLGVVVAAHRHEARDLSVRSLLGIAALAGLATFANLAWVTPEANHAFKLAAWAEQLRLHPEVNLSVFRGDREMTLHQLAQRAADLRDGSRSLEAGYYALELHKMPAIGAWCLVMALAGAAMARGIRRSALRWMAALALCWIWFVLLRLGEQAADAGQVNPALAMWGPVGVATVLASMALWRSSPTPMPAHPAS